MSLIVNDFDDFIVGATHGSPNFGMVWMICTLFSSSLYNTMLSLFLNLSLSGKLFDKKSRKEDGFWFPLSFGGGLMK